VPSASFHTTYNLHRLQRSTKAAPLAGHFMANQPRGLPIFVTTWAVSSFCENRVFVPFPSLGIWRGVLVRVGRCREIASAGKYKCLLAWPVPATMCPRLLPLPRLAMSLWRFSIGNREHPSPLRLNKKAPFQSPRGHFPRLFWRAHASRY
jgi:hypothetical protein